MAMSNAKGGMILFGIKDKTGEIRGLSYQEIQQTNSMLADIATNLLRPVIYIQTESVIMNERSVLIAHVCEGDNKPYKDLNGVIWTKQGADKRKVMENSEIIRLFQRSGMLYADEQPIPSTSVEDVDDRLLERFIRKEYGREKEDFDIPYEELLRNLTITSGGRMTLAGLLFFGKNPQQYRPIFVIKAVSFFGNDIAGVSYRDSKDLTGTLPELFDKGMSFLKSNLRNIQAGQNFNSIGKLEISEIVLEELLQNALVHRDYTRNAPVRLLIFDNRVEIISPGRLPDGLTVENIRFGNAVVRNPFVANFCAKTMPYRGLGSGIIRALKEIPTIEFTNDVVGEQFVSTIARPDLEGVNVHNEGVKTSSEGANNDFEGVKADFEGVNEIEALVLNLLKYTPGQRANEISVGIGKSISTTERYISSLKLKGLIEFRGAPKTGGYYRIESSSVFSSSSSSANTSGF